MGKAAESRATITLPNKTGGRTLKRGAIEAWKFTRPIQAATPTPMANPRSAPTAPREAASAAKKLLTRR